MISLSDCASAAAASTSGLTWPAAVPCGDHTRTLARQRIVGDAGKPSAQLDSSGELAALIEGSTDRSGIDFGH
jgi:hypothetical protein